MEKKSRLFFLRKSLFSAGFEAFLITDQENVSYLTGISGLKKGEREVFLFLSPKKNYLLSFPTFPQFSQGDFSPLLVRNSFALFSSLEKIIRQEKIKKIAIEEENLTLAQFKGLKKNLSAQILPTKNLVENFRVIKEEKEIKLTQKAASLTTEAFDFLLGKIKRGISERQLALMIEFFLKEKGGEVAFSPIVAFGPNSAIPHYLPQENQRLQPETLILFDFGAKIEGYCADFTRVIFFGKKPKTAILKAYQAVFETKKKVLAKLKEKIKTSRKKPFSLPAAFFDQLAKKFLQEKGFPPYPHGLGHGVGLSIHEAPFLKIKSQDFLRPGMIFTLEPAVYLPGIAGIRLEDLILLKEKEAKALTPKPKAFFPEGNLPCFFR